MTMRRRMRALGGAAVLAISLGAAAQPLQPAPRWPSAPQGVVNLAASASADIARDWLAISFSAVREGSDAAALQAALKQALDAALTQARRVERAGEIEVRTGSFALTPRYTPKGENNGWRGHAELIVQGRDLNGIAQLAGRINTMGIARVQQSLSRQRRAEAEGAITAQAIAAWRAKATAAATLFGYSAYVLREVSVSALDQPPQPMMMSMRARSADSASEESLPVQAGNETVSVTVQGSIQLQPAP